MMNIREVFKLLRSSHSTLYRWVAEGFIRRKTMGQSYDYNCDSAVYQSLTLAKDESPLLEGWNDLRELMFTYITYLKVSLTIK